jgi:hypothetical protein
MYNAITMPNPTIFHLLSEYLKATGAYWWVVFVGVLMPLPDIWKHFHPQGKELPLPRWLRWTAGLICISLAQFLTYRDQAINLAKVIEEKRQFSVRINELEDQTRILRSVAEDGKKQKRLAIVSELTNLLARNNQIRENCESDTPPKGFSCVNEKDRWIRQTRSYISKNMGPSYLARFKGTTGTFANYKTPSGKWLPPQDSEAVSLLAISGGALDQFIKEFQN